MKKGFTLIELLVVISIIGVLIGLALVAFGPTRKSSRDAKRRVDIESLRSALEIYRSNNGAYPALLTDLQSGGYIDAVPPDPLTSNLYGYARTGCSGSPTVCTGYKLCASLEIVTTADARCGVSISPAVTCGGTCSYFTKNP